MELINCCVVALDADGLKSNCLIVGREFEVSGDDGVELVASLTGGRIVRVFSSVGVFDALRKIRRELETENIRLHCFGSDEAVYPSPMQEAMGLNTLAYRNKMGQQATSLDIVDIFSSDTSVRVASIEEQENFHKRWLESL